MPQILPVEIFNSVALTRHLKSIHRKALPVGYRQAPDEVVQNKKPCFALRYDERLSGKTLSGLEEPPILFFEKELFEHIINDVEKLKNDSNPLQYVAIPRTFVYLDISDFSKFFPRQQLDVITTLIKLSMFHEDNKDPSEALVGNILNRLCIGDGYVFVFSKPHLAVQFACVLAHLIDTMSGYYNQTKFHYRIGIHTGDVYHFWDPGRNGLNYTGDGINGGNRILSAVGKTLDDVIFLSDETRSKIQNISEVNETSRKMLACMDNRGRSEDKHGNKWRVYLINHTRLVQELRDMKKMEALIQKHLTKPIQ